MRPINQYYDVTKDLDTPLWELLKKEIKTRSK